MPACHGWYDGPIRFPEPVACYWMEYEDRIAPQVGCGFPYPVLLEISPDRSRPVEYPFVRCLHCDGAVVDDWLGTQSWRDRSRPFTHPVDEE